MAATQKNNHEQGEAKLEDILKSIRCIIDDQNYSFTDDGKTDSNEHEGEILELTNIFNPEVANDSNALISEDTKRKAEAEIARFTSKIKEDNFAVKDDSLNSMVNQLMQPLIKEWLNSNLPRIVEKVVTEEIKRIIPKK